uniref:RNA-directed DNA polymerase n=1 Tax=Phytophthora ramorum TaxID=164328 RepID=H3H639_PHYRM
MVPRPGSTTPEDGVTIKQEPEAGAPSIQASSTASELEERRAASWSSEGTFTTGHGASDKQEAYEDTFAVPDVAPTGATKGFDESRSPRGRKSAKTDDQQSPPAKPKRKKTKQKKKKLRAPDSADEAPRKVKGENAGREYTTDELTYGLSRVELFRQLERDPVLDFLKPKLIGELTGPCLVPDLSSLTNVRLAASALFRMLRGSGFVLGAFEMEKVYDWDLESWKHAIKVLVDPLMVLVGTIKIPATDRKKESPAPAPPHPYRFQSSSESDSSVESPKRMPMPTNRPPRVMQLAAASTQPAAATLSEGAIPKTLEDAIVRLMQSTMMRATSTPTQPSKSEPTVAPQQEDADVAMESASSHSSGRPKRSRPSRDEDPDDLFDLDDGAAREAATVSAATVGMASTGMTRVRLSAFSELKEFHGRDSSEEKARAWLNRMKSASRRDGMTGDEVCALFGDLMAGPARQWYLQLTRGVKTSWTDLTEQFRIQYCGKAKHPDETPLEYLYRLNVAGMRAKIRYDDGTAEEKREHVELFINTLGSQEQELASRLTLMEVPDVEILEKKLRARQRGLAHQKKTLFGSNKFRQKAPAPPPPVRAVHAIQTAADEYDSGRDAQDSDDQMYDQDRDAEERARLPQEVASEDSAALIDNICEPDQGPTPCGRVPRVANVRYSSEYEREAPLDVIDLQPGERRGYWKHYAPDKWYRQAKIHGKLNNRRATLLLDTGAEVSILDTTFAREVGCRIDTDVTQNCVGIRDETYYTVGRTRIKVTLAGNLVYFLDIWIGELVGQDAILGMNFMVPAGVRIDTADGTACLPDEVRVPMIGRRPLYGAKMRPVMAPTSERISPGKSYDIRLRPDRNAPRLWVTRGSTWVTTVVRSKTGRWTYLRVTNIADKTIMIDAHMKLGWWTPADALPRDFGFVQVSSRRYQEWQNLAYGASCDADDHWSSADDMELGEPMTERPTYEIPKRIMRRGESTRPSSTEERERPPRVTAVTTVPEPEGDLGKARERRGETALKKSQSDEIQNDSTGMPSGKAEETDRLNQATKSQTHDVEAEEAVFFHEGSELFAEELQAEMAILPEISLTKEVKIEDLKVGRPTGVAPEIAAKQEERLRRIIWKRRKWLIGKGNALPPAAVGVVCDIDVGDAKPIAQRVRKIPPQFREKVSDLLKGLLSAKMIQISKSSWASPIVVIVKKNGTDIRLCIDYRLVNELTQLLVYPMPLVNDLLEDLDGYLWYCSLDMASGFWVVPMTDRARLVSAFITPFGLFEWLRMPFGLCNAPQIYQRLIDNALYGFWSLSPSHDTRDVFDKGDPVTPGSPSVLSRRSYIDDILIGGTTWDDLCTKVERLLDVCEQWHLSISVEKSEWGMTQVGYLGHKVSGHGLEAKPKNLESLTTLAFPHTLKGLQSFLGSLNYYHRFIADFAIYATTLYALTEADFDEYPDKPGVHSQPKWTHALNAFESLKMKLAHTPMLKHFDATREPVVIVYASDWAISAVLTQSHDDVYMPVKFTSRTLKPNELNYSIVEKEILALLRVLNDCFAMLAGKTIRVLVRHTTLAWLFRSKGLQGRLSQWAAILSPWKLDICRSMKGEEEILGTLAASITPRAYVDSALEEITPRKRSSKITDIPIPIIVKGEELYVMSFDGSAKAKREGGAFSAVVWKLPGWEIVRAASSYMIDLTVNEAEYRGMLLGCSLLDGLNVSRLIVCGDSNLVIRQMREEMDCKSPGLKLLKQRASCALQKWPRHDLFHDTPDPHRLEENRADDGDGTTPVLPVTTRSAAARAAPTQTRTPEVMQELVVQRLRLDRIRIAQDEELWIANLKKYLNGDLGGLSRREAKDCSKIAHQYEEGEGGLLYYHTREVESAEDRDMIMKLVVPETLQGDILHHYHASLEGGHQATYPFQVVAMDHIPSLPASYKGNTELLVWVDLFTGFVIAKANSSRTAQTVAEAYEEAVFRRFGASEAIRHDREPGFMSDFFRAFNKLMGQRQRATLAYRPQANGAAERMVQTITRAIKMYITDVDQRDWDEYAERLTFALNTAHDRTRNETPFYLVHGWDPRSTLEASLAIGNTSHRDVEAKRWRLRIQRHYKMARAQALELVRDAVDARARLRNEDATEHPIQAGSQVWLYLDRVKPGYARKLAHMWHGPFRVAELVSTYAVRLETDGTPYQLYPIVHISKLKPVRQFPTRPDLELTIPVDSRFDFDEQFLPEDSWEAQELGSDVYEVEQVLNVRKGRATRYGRARREFEVQWKGYPDTTWVDELDLNCGGLLYDFLRRRTGQHRFEMMQSYENAEVAEPGAGEADPGG